MGANSALSQPQQALLIDRSNPITRGLAVAILPIGAGPRDVIVNAAPTLTGPLALATYPAGRAWMHGSGSYSLFDSPVYGNVGADGGVTEFSLLSVVSTDDWGCLWVSGDGTGQTTTTNVYRISNGTNFTYAVDNGAAGVDTAGGEMTTLLDGAMHALLCTAGPAGLRIDLDGKTVASTTGISAGRSNGRLIFSRDISTNGSQATANYALYLRWNRSLTLGESISLKRNPWQVFYKSAAALSAFTAGGATDTPINPGVGTLAITGYAPTVAQPRTAAPGVGSLTLTGYAPTVLQNTNVAPGVGSLTITGFAPTVAQPKAVNPGAGALVLTSYAPVVSQPQAVLPGAGSITITGYAPTVTQAAGQNVAPGVGTLAITGYAPSITQPQTANPGAGSIALTGYAPGVVQNTQVAPGAGSVALTGYAPAVTQQINVTAGAGLLTLTGYAPNVARTANQAVAPGVGTITITGFAPTVTQASASISLTPGVGQITIAGYAPDVQQSVDQRTTGAGSDIGGAERRPRYWHDAQRKPLLQRVLEARAEERRVKPVKERQRKRAKAAEIEAAKVVLRTSSADGGEERFGELMRQWLAQRPVLPGGGADAMQFFLAQVAFRLAQMDALDKAAAAFAAMDDDEEALLALLLL